MHLYIHDYHESYEELLGTKCHALGVRLLFHTNIDEVAVLVQFQFSHHLSPALVWSVTSRDHRTRPIADYPRSVVTRHILLTWPARPGHSASDIQA